VTSCIPAVGNGSLPVISGKKLFLNDQETGNVASAGYS